MVPPSSNRERRVNQGQTVFAQLIALIPHKQFQRCVLRYQGDRRVRRFTCWDQFLSLAFAQLTYRESLRDIEACLGAVPEKLYHMGFRCGPISRSTLADANESRDWRIFADFAQTLISEARRLYSDEPWGLELEQTVYALDATIIDLCLSLFPWARFRSTKAGIKVHTLLDLRGNIPSYIWVTDAKTADERVLDVLLPEPGSIYVLDRGYVDFKRLYTLHQAHAIFVTRAHRDLRFERRYSHPVDRSTGLLCDQTIVLDPYTSGKRYREPLRRIRYRHIETSKQLVFLTNDMQLPALSITELYRQRWQVELFFKWIKQHLRIKAFYGTSPNAVRIQIWVAISVYVLVAIVRKRLGSDRDLYTLLQILSITLLEKVPLSQALTDSDYKFENVNAENQLSLFTF
jgi:hypothetical protein